MDHKRINKLLKKISNLNDSISEDPEFSGLEREHIIGYIEKLYSEVKGEKMKVQREEDLSAPIVIEEEEVILEEEIIEEDIVEEEEVSDIEEAPASQKEIEEPIVLAYDDELLSLFDDASGNELSDKLSQLPIKDLTKAVSINERIFTIKELFGNNKDEYKNMMVALNGLDTFEDAKQVLLGSVATKYDWGSTDKMNKAAGFIKTVRRRYL